MSQAVAAPVVEGSDYTEITSAIASVPSRSKGGTRAVAGGNLAELADRLQAHYRYLRRTLVEIECDVNILLSEGLVFDSGTAQLKNISPSGGLVGMLQLKRECLPLKPFRLVLRLKTGDYAGICIEATPVRFAPEAGGIGVRFDEVSVKA